jgi:hypothetical protein
MLCGSPAMLADLKVMLEKRDFEEGNTSTPGDFVVERAFVEKLAQPLERLRELYAQRDPLYRQTAHYVIETGRPSVGTLVNMIVMQLDLAGLTPQAAP